MAGPFTPERWTGAKGPARDGRVQNPNKYEPGTASSSDLTCVSDPASLPRAHDVTSKGSPRQIY
jgi:hypothetical protein